MSTESPTSIETEEASSTEPSAVPTPLLTLLVSYQLAIHGPTMKVQTSILKEIASAAGPYRKELAGLVSLLEEIARQAFEVYGIDARDVAPAQAMADLVHSQAVTVSELQELVASIVTTDAGSAAALLQALSPHVSAIEHRQLLASILQKRSLVVATEPVSETPTETPTNAE